MKFILCSSAVVICLISQVSSQPPIKPTTEWSPDRPEMYPNPRVDFTKCNRPEPSGLCDVNTILTDEERNEFGKMIELKEQVTSKVYEGCAASRIDVTVAIMKQIGPHITEYRVASKEFAQKFVALWQLGNCSVILIASKLDNTGCSEAGSAVKELLPVNKTEEIDWETYENYFKKGLLVEGLNETMIRYRTALEEAAAAAQTTPKPGGNESSASNIINQPSSELQVFGFFFFLDYSPTMLGLLSFLLCFAVTSN